ncbi:alpha/beta hydrolase [Kineococcus sp. NUM-3379]
MTTLHTTPATTPGTVRSVDGTTLAYESCGSGPVLVVVDGATGHRACGGGRGLAPHLAADLTVVAYDRRGRGGSSDTAPYAVQREVEDLAALIGAVGGEAFLYGISSGGCLSLLAAAAGLPVRRLAVFEAPVDDARDPVADHALRTTIADLAAAGRRGEAVATFQRACGVPEEVVQQYAPSRGPAEAVAHTIPYDLAVCEATSTGVVRRVPVPALVLDSAGSGAGLTGWFATVVGALPHGEHRSLRGQWHRVADEDLAPVLREFLLRG